MALIELKNEHINFLYDPNHYKVNTSWMLLTFWTDYGDNYMRACSWHEDVIKILLNCILELEYTSYLALLLYKEINSGFLDLKVVAYLNIFY